MCIYRAGGVWCHTDTRFQTLIAFKFYEYDINGDNTGEKK